MSCNGCRVLRKGCNENCILRQSLQFIDSPQAQSYATVFVAKFFGRAGLMSFLSAVPDSQRPALFQSLLFEACGRTVNPVNGAVGLLWTGNWKVCQSAVETILRGGALREMPELISGAPPPAVDYESEANDVGLFRSSPDLSLRRSKAKDLDNVARSKPPSDLDLNLTSCQPPVMIAGGKVDRRTEKRRARTPSEESETTTLESGSVYHHSFQGQGGGTKLLRLFV